MTSQYKFWLWAVAILQLSTAAVHTLGFYFEPEPANDMERQIHQMVTTYRPSLGPHFTPTLHDLNTALGACFSLLYAFGGLLNVFLLQRNLNPELLKGTTGIQALIFGAGFLIMLMFTFLPPIVLTGLVFLALCFAYATNHIHLIKLKN